jgi:hypothetical protein
MGSGDGAQRRTEPTHGLLDSRRHAYTTSLSDDEFNRIFTTTSSITSDFLLFEDGQSSVNHFNHVNDNGGLQHFSFDSLVDFDPPQPSIGDDHSFFEPIKAEPTSDLSDPLAGTTLGLQPGFGASSEGCDGLGIAAGV